MLKVAGPLLILKEVAGRLGLSEFIFTKQKKSILAKPGCFVFFIE